MPATFQPTFNNWSICDRIFVLSIKVLPTASFLTLNFTTIFQWHVKASIKVAECSSDYLKAWNESNHFNVDISNRLQNSSLHHCIVYTFFKLVLVDFANCITSCPVVAFNELTMQRKQTLSPVRISVHRVYRAYLCTVRLYLCKTWRRLGEACLISALGRVWGINVTPPAALSAGKQPDYPFNERMDGPQDSYELFSRKENSSLCRASNHNFMIVQALGQGRSKRRATGQLPGC